MGAAGSSIGLPQLARHAEIKCATQRAERIADLMKTALDHRGARFRAIAFPELTEGVQKVATSPTDAKLARPAP